MFGRGWLRTLSLLFAFVLVAMQPTLAQSSSLLAFINSAGQLIISSGDGSYRWIVTNPGEVLNRTLGYSWSPDGRRVFFALGEGDVSLRVGDTSSQSVSEIGRLGGQVSGGNWMPDGSAVVVASGNQLVAVPAGGGQALSLAAASDTITVRSPMDAAGDRAHLSQSQSMSSDGQFLFFAQGGGNVVQSVGGAPIPVMGGDPVGQYSGLWSEVAPLVTYNGMGATSMLAVTNAATGATLQLDSGRMAPINPIAWVPGTTLLIYRDATNFVRIVDVGCLTSQCADNPLQRGEELLPASAAEVQTEGGWVFFLDGEMVKAVSLGCVGTGGCAGSAVTLGANVAPQTILDVGGTTLAYTAYAANAYDPADREARVVNLQCLSNPASCQAAPMLAGAVSGFVSPDGQYVVVEAVGGGLSVLRLFDGQTTYLSDPAGGSLLTRARWNIQ